MKYNLSEIMKNAWSIKKSHKDLSFSHCLRRAWEKAKQAALESSYIGCKFQNGMKITINGVARTLNRWTKNGMDRVYLNYGDYGRKTDGYVDLVNGRHNLYNKYEYLSKMADAIVTMQF